MSAKLYSAFQKEMPHGAAWDCDPCHRGGWTSCTLIVLAWLTCALPDVLHSNLVGIRGDARPGQSIDRQFWYREDKLPAPFPDIGQLRSDFFS